MSISNIDKLPFTTSVKDTIKLLVNYALQKSNNINKIVLFGSYARAEYKATSDLDILLITEFIEDRFIKGDISSFFEENNADAVFFSEDQFRNSDCLLVQKIKEEGILLWRR
mgnify:CR=1 FL=1